MSGDVQPSRLSVEELAAAIGVTPERWRMKFIADAVIAAGYRKASPWIPASVHDGGGYKVADEKDIPWLLANREWLLSEVKRLTPRTVTTAEELDALPVGSVVMELLGDAAEGGPQPVGPFGIPVMPGVFHRFPDGWYVVAGHGVRDDIILPATVLHVGGDR